MTEQPTDQESKFQARSKGKKTSPKMGEARLDRLPPHSLEAEQGVLSCVLQAPNESMPECIQAFRGTAEPFYDLRHRTIYERLMLMYDKKQPIDLITVQQNLKNENQLENIGGIAYLQEIIDFVASPVNLPSYAAIVREKYLLRRMIQTCIEAVHNAYEFEGEIDRLMDEVERKVLQVNQERSGDGMLNMRELVKEVITQIEQYHDREGGLVGISTGLADLDRMTSGLKGGEMIVIAARPSMGKTSLAMNIVESVAIDQNIPTGVFSLEMTAQSLVMRMICSRARVSSRDIVNGFLEEADFGRLSRAAGDLSHSPMYIDDTPGLSILQLRAKARRMAQQHGIKFIVIDYLQLLHSTATRADNRQQEIADISNGVKALAKELNLPVIVLSQLNREFEKDKNRKPRLSDLRESGSIEQDADIVGLLYRAEKEPDDDSDTQVDPNQAVAVNLLIAKQRNGPTGDVYLVFRRSITRFEGRAKEDPSEGVPYS
ncbi:MAG: replicative DNA helicase [Verrucomicrobia bacterium]|nr:replicative DNA helicase [Verrucomicrobiota bacterium]